MHWNGAEFKTSYWLIAGDDIREWQDIEDPVARQAKWDWALDHDQIVFARVSPAHKLLIVENCQRRGACSSQLCPDYLA